MRGKLANYRVNLVMKGASGYERGQVKPFMLSPDNDALDIA